PGVHTTLVRFEYRFPTGAEEFLDLVEITLQLPLTCADRACIVRFQLIDNPLLKIDKVNPTATRQTVLLHAYALKNIAKSIASVHLLPSGSCPKAWVYELGTLPCCSK